MEISQIITVIAVLVSFFSLLVSWASVKNSKHFWLSTHRPVVTAEIVVDKDGVGMALFDLVIYNSGNRPAVNIKIYAKKDDIENIFSENASTSGKNITRQVFSESNKIALLLNGKETKTHFGAFSENGCDADILKYEAELLIHINYQDVEGKDYNSKISLYMRDAKGFGGTITSSA